MRKHNLSSPIIPWVGGKRRLIKQILPHFPVHKCYVEPFCGGAALFFSKPPAKVEVLNDINGELMNLYLVVKVHLEEFVRQFKWALSSRQLFDWHQQTPPHTLTDIQRAARFYYLQQLAFGGWLGGSFGTSTTCSRRFNLLRLEEQLSQAHLRLSDATIEHLGWQDCIEKYDRPHTLFYLDPPYWNTQGYGVSFPFDEYENIAQRARTLQGNMLISVNDIPEMREVFAGLPQKSLTLNYCVGRQPHKARELLIGNPSVGDALTL
ncbi:DNA adenine methylase [Candidatus Sodalis endolongispinus]|uniref:site-specific DNA-methyltransferase (adenine-specific) n=1 Tax=Candidatus Sodalis endolongispinus TaxID=2812662 RepID=A0ABS5Y8U3_9GAMM|nr:DNA adenine methylase [Candidatus Sodalis endolongispinus]MBT9431069.1 DNA adenine methylase [Candidatus Sodalis endolongispinus]